MLGVSFKGLGKGQLKYAVRGAKFGRFSIIRWEELGLKGEAELKYVMGGANFEIFSNL